MHTPYLQISATGSSQMVYPKDVGDLSIKTTQKIPKFVVAVIDFLHCSALTSHHCSAESNLELYTEVKEVIIDVQSFFLFGKATTILPTFIVHLTPASILTNNIVTFK